MHCFYVIGVKFTLNRDNLFKLNTKHEFVQLGGLHMVPNLGRHFIIPSCITIFWGKWYDIFHSQMMAIKFSFLFPIPKVENLFSHSHSQSPLLGIRCFMLIPNPKCEKVIPAHAWVKISKNLTEHTSLPAIHTPKVGRTPPKVRFRVYKLYRFNIYCFKHKKMLVHRIEILHIRVYSTSQKCEDIITDTTALYHSYCTLSLYSTLHSPLPLASWILHS